MPPHPLSVPQMMQPVMQESNGRRMCSSSLVTAISTSAVWFPFVSKHPEAVLLLTAQRSVLLTFNKFMIFCGAAMLPPLLRCTALSTPGHTWGPLMWKSRGFSALIMQQLPLHKRAIGQAVPRDPQQQRCSADIFFLLLPSSTDLNVICSPVPEASSQRLDTSPWVMLNSKSMTSPGCVAVTHNILEGTYGYYKRNWATFYFLELWLIPTIRVSLQSSCP